MRKHYLAVARLTLAAMVWLFAAAEFSSAGPPLGMIAEITTNTSTEFGVYKPVRVLISPSAQPYTIAPDFGNVINFSQFTFTTTQAAILRSNGFVVFPKAFPAGWGHQNHPYGEMYDIYNYAREQNLPIFVTVDALLHTYHELYDRVLRTIESQKLLLDLDRLTSAMIIASRAQYDQATDPKVKSAAQLNVAYFAVAAKLLSTTFTVPADVAATVTVELALINAHAGLAVSPIFKYQEDYTQYVPRGHYTLSPDLEKYFRAMMWLGRMTFFCENPATPGTFPPFVREATRRALLITHAMNKTMITTATAMSVWNRIYQPTVFFVGKSEDLTVTTYTAHARIVYGSNLTAVPVNDFGNETKLTTFLNRIAAEPPPQIAADEWGKGFRFMGQRFIPDSYMFERLVLPFVPSRTMPRGLDAMAVLGSPRAWQILDQFYHDTSYSSYTAQMNRLKAQFDAMDDGVWAQNLYWNWLYCLMPMLVTKGPGFPTYMRSAAWKDKDLACALGSWAELRHDTILYAKQSASCGGSQAAFRDTFVEANPWAFARMAALTRLTIDGLTQQNLMLTDFNARLLDLEQLLLSLKRVADKELTNQPLTIEECRMIRMIGRRLSYLILPKQGSDFIDDDDMAIIADVHSDYVSGQCLEVGVGRPLTIYVVNRDEDRLVVAMGSAYSYYEFAQPLTNRLTDELWQEMLSGATPPKPPVWTGSYVDLSARFDLDAPGNAHDPYGNPYQPWGDLRITVAPAATPPNGQYRIHVSSDIHDYDGNYTTLTLQAILGIREKLGEVTGITTDSAQREEYEGMLDLRGWPGGLVILSVYSPRDTNIVDSVTFRHQASAAISPKRWPLYDERRKR